MAIDLRIGEHQLQELDKAPQAIFLPRCPRVGRFAVSVQTAYVADADAVRIVVLAVATRVLQGLTDFYTSAQVDDVVVAAVRTARHGEVTLLMPLCDVLQPEILTGLRGRAMDDDFIDFSHFFLVLLHDY